MSAGSLVWARYQSVENPNNIYHIHCQEETLSLEIGGAVNSSAAGIVNMPDRVKVSKGTREFGKRPFMVQLGWQIGGPPKYDPYGLIVLPLLNSTIRSMIKKGAVGMYLGMPVDVRGTLPENIV